MAGDHDLVVAFRGMDQVIANFGKRTCRNCAGKIMLPGCGHWTQQERALEGQRGDNQFFARAVTDGRDGPPTLFNYWQRSLVAARNSPT